MKRLIYLIANLFLLTSYSLAVNPLNVGCYFSGGWPVTRCSLTNEYEDSSSEKTLFTPDKKQNIIIPTCFKVGCHPMFCSDWKKNIRNACKTEYKRIAKKSPSLLPTIQKKIKQQTFEGCAEMPQGTGVLAPMDWLGRKLFTKSWYHICSTDPEIKQTDFLKWAHENGPKVKDFITINTKNALEAARQTGSTAKEKIAEQWQTILSSSFSKDTQEPEDMYLQLKPAKYTRPVTDYIPTS